MLPSIYTGVTLLTKIIRHSYHKLGLKHLIVNLNEI